MLGGGLPLGLILAAEIVVDHSHEAEDGEGLHEVEEDHDNVANGGDGHDDEGKDGPDGGEHDDLHDELLGGGLSPIENILNEQPHGRHE